MNRETLAMLLIAWTDMKWMDARSRSSSRKTKGKRLTRCVDLAKGAGVAVAEAAETEIGAEVATGGGAEEIHEMIVEDVIEIGIEVEAEIVAETETIPTTG
jgi:hypothetical protein